MGWPFSRRGVADSILAAAILEAAKWLIFSGASGGAVGLVVANIKGLSPFESAILMLLGIVAGVVIVLLFAPARVPYVGLLARRRQRPLTHSVLAAGQTRSTEVGGDEAAREVMRTLRANVDLSPLRLILLDPHYEGGTTSIRFLLSNNGDRAVTGCSVWLVSFDPAPDRPRLGGLPSPNMQLRWLGGELPGTIPPMESVQFGFVEVGEEKKQSDGTIARSDFRITTRAGPQYTIGRGEYIATVGVKTADQELAPKPSRFRVRYAGDHNLRAWPEPGPKTA